MPGWMRNLFGFEFDYPEWMFGLLLGLLPFAAFLVVRWLRAKGRTPSGPPDDPLLEPVAGPLRRHRLVGALLVTISVLIVGLSIPLSWMLTTWDTTGALTVVVTVGLFLAPLAFLGGVILLSWARSRLSYVAFVLGIVLWLGALYLLFGTVVY